MSFTSESGMNDVTDVPSLLRVQRGKEAATYFDLYLNVHLFISITVLHPCFPLLFHARLHALFIHGPKPRLQAFFILVGSIQFGDYYINTMFCSHCSINSAYCKQSTWLSLPPGGVESLLYHPQLNLSHLEFNVMYNANTQIWEAPLIHCCSKSHFLPFLWRKTKNMGGERGIHFLQKVPT